MKWYVIMKLTFDSVEYKKEFKGGRVHFKELKYEYPVGQGEGMGGNPSNHFPSCKIKMHELNKAETDPLVLYHIMSTNY